MLPSASDLIYFQEIAKTLNITRTAEVLGISQPSLSLAIKRLEENIGAELLIREKRGVQLTRAGIELLIGSREIIALWEKISVNSRTQKEEVKGKYQFGCHASVALYSLNKFFPQLIQKYPDLEMDLIHENSRVICQRIIDHSTDIGLVINPIAHPDLIIVPLFKDEVCLWKHQDYTINEQSKLLCDTSLVQTQALLKKIKKLGFHRKQILPSNNLEVIAELTNQKVGVGILPSRVVGNIKGNKLVRLNSTPIFKDKLCLVYHLQAKGLKAIQAIKKEVQESLG